MTYVLNKQLVDMHSFEWGYEKKNWLEIDVCNYVTFSTGVEANSRAQPSLDVYL